MNYFDYQTHMRHSVCRLSSVRLCCFSPFEQNTTFVDVNIDS